MSGEMEYGKCQICKKETYLERTYFRYDLKCECHSPQHFELIIHCKDCVPVEPRVIRVELVAENYSLKK